MGFCDKEKTLMSEQQQQQQIDIDVLINALWNRYPALISCKDEILTALYVMEEAFSNDKKLLIAGNGGSAADAEHIVGELMKGFKSRRPIPATLSEDLKSINLELGLELTEKLECALPAISLSSHESLLTAYINDVGALCVFAQQILGYGKQGDVFLAISTSGNSQNIILAAITAKALGLKVIALTGELGGRLADYADVVVRVPATEAYQVQEFHLPIYHWWCLMLEKRFFGDDGGHDDSYDTNSGTSYNVLAHIQSCGEEDKTFPDAIKGYEVSI